MTEPVQPLPKPKTTPPFTQELFTEEYFKEIENRAYRGTRKALFQSMLVSIAGFVVVWLVMVIVGYMIIVPYMSSMLGGSTQTQMNPTEVLKQLDELKSVYK